MKRFSIPPREERERHSHTMSAYCSTKFKQPLLLIQTTVCLQQKDNRLSPKERLFLSEGKRHYYKGYSSKAYKMVDK